MVNTQEYFEHPNISQSELKLLLSGSPRAFTRVREKELYFEEKRHFTVGSAVDCMLTQGQEEFDTQYYIGELENKPTDVIKSILNEVFDFLIQDGKEASELSVISSESYKSVIIQMANSHNYYANRSDDFKYSKICEYYEYWDELRNSQGKIILSQNELVLINSIVMSLKSSDITGKYLHECDDNNIEKLYQFPIYFTYLDVECKALLDLVIIDHINKTIQPIDIKTLGDYTFNFPKSVRQRRYDIQAAYYTQALKIHSPGYVILPFKFLVESTTYPGTPLVFTCSESLLSLGKYGMPGYYTTGTILDNRTNIIVNRYTKLKGFVDLIELYKYYQENGFEEDKRIVENSGEFIIDFSGIIE